MRDDAQHATELGVRQGRQQLGHACDATRGPARSGRRRARRPRRARTAPARCPRVRRPPAVTPSCHDPDRPDGDPRDVLDRPAVHARADGGERDARRTELHGQLEGPREAGGQQHGVGLSAVPVGADGVHHPAGGQPEPRGRDGVSHGQPVGQRGPAQLPARGQQLRPGGRVDRPVDSPATEQGRVRGVDDDVDVLRGDVPEDGLDQHPAIIVATSTPTWVRPLGRLLRGAFTGSQGTRGPRPDG